MAFTLNFLKRFRRSFRTSDAAPKHLCYQPTWSPGGLMESPAHVGQALHWDLPDDPVIIGQARDLVRDTLTSWNLHDLIDDITLVISELVTNALIHGAPPIRLCLDLTPEAVTGHVYDQGAGRPRCLTVRHDSEHGRGMSIVAALTDEWRYEPAPCGTGKTIWFSRSLEPASPPSHST
ncbi:ATP-binding protein [Nonomuraea guangzhouensis]|uniref:ATP-binding protein n=1 Tax=Nonomuraea guangzhouensis TaxID=1291555 RepID=A0ABW4GLS5_9ACTN|nr:ATP-binding protein [Nonomuraea guangzhouensis]